MKGMRPAGLVVVASLLVLAATPTLKAAPPAITPIQPGAPLGFWPLPNGPNAECTLNFVFRDSGGNWFVGAAAHCVNLGERVGNSQAGTFGTVVVDDDDELPGGSDFALIRIDAGKTGLVSPAVRGWGGPTGIVIPAQARGGDLLAFHGYPAGTGFGHPLSVQQISTVQTRVGVLSKVIGDEFRYNAPDIPGDSGAPFLLHENGKALGIGTQTAFYAQIPDLPAVGKGHTLAAIMERMSVHGFSLSLQTAPFGPVPV